MNFTCSHYTLVYLKAALLSLKTGGFVHGIVPPASFEKLKSNMFSDKP